MDDNSSRGYVMVLARPQNARPAKHRFTHDPGQCTGIDRESLGGYARLRD